MRALLTEALATLRREGEVVLTFPAQGSPIAPLKVYNWLLDKVNAVQYDEFDREIETDRVALNYTFIGTKLFINYMDRAPVSRSRQYYL